MGPDGRCFRNLGRKPLCLSLSAFSNGWVPPQSTELLALRVDVTSHCVQGGVSHWRMNESSCFIALWRGEWVVSGCPTHSGGRQMTLNKYATVEPSWSHHPRYLYFDLIGMLRLNSTQGETSAQCLAHSRLAAGVTAQINIQKAG